MTFNLRPYQKELIQNASVSVAKNKNIILQSPGGTGKSKILITIARNAASKGRAVIIMTTFQKVYSQLYDECGGIKIGDGVKYVDVKDGQIYIASVQTLVKRPKIIDQFNNLHKEVLILHDECHISAAKKIYDMIPNRMSIGLTATPDYKIAKHLPDIYTDIVCAPPIPWFIDNGYLCDYQHIVRKSGKATSSLKKSGGDFNEFEQRKFFGTEEHYQELFKDLSSVPFKKCMVFTASIKHADEVNERMTQEGYKCSISHSKRSDNDYQMAKFTTLHETNIIISVGSLTTGFDFPDVDCIVLYRATTSLALYLQMVFRADRPKEGMFFWVLDYGLNGERHKPYNYTHDWSTMWKEKPKKEKSGVAGIKICPECDSMLFVAATNCKFCGYVFPPSDNPKELGTAEDITNRKAELSGKRISELTPKQLSLYANLFDKKKFAIRVARTNGQDFMKEFASKMGYSSGWLHQQDKFKDQIGFKDFML